MPIANLYLNERQQICGLDDFIFFCSKEEQVLFCFSQANMGAYTHHCTQEHWYIHSCT